MQIHKAGGFGLFKAADYGSEVACCAMRTGVEDVVPLLWSLT
jgi:hypothetical protein